MEDEVAVHMPKDIILSGRGKEHSCTVMSLSRGRTADAGQFSWDTHRTRQSCRASCPRSHAQAGHGDQEPRRCPATLTAMFRGRADRIIAAGRLLLAAGGFVAVWLDPAQPRRYQAFAYGVLGSYTLYALLILLRVWRSDSLHVRGTFRRHAGDLLVFAVIMYLTSGPTSPFFVYFALPSWRACCTGGGGVPCPRRLPAC